MDVTSCDCRPPKNEGAEVLAPNGGRGIIDTMRIGRGFWGPVALALLSLAGCPYESDQPLSDPGAAAADPRLVGSWTMHDRDTGEIVTLAFSPAGGQEMTASALADTEEEETTYRVFVTSIGPARFLNVHEEGGGGEGWYFIRYRIEGDRLFLHVVDDALFPSSSLSQEGLRGTILQHLEDPRLYGDEPGQSTEVVWERPGS